MIHSNRELIYQQAAKLDSQHSSSLAGSSGMKPDQIKPEEDTISSYGKEQELELWKAKINEYQTIINSYLEIMYTKDGSEGDKKLNPYLSSRDIENIKQTIIRLSGNIKRLEEFLAKYNNTLSVLGKDAVTSQLQEVV